MTDIKLDIPNITVAVTKPDVVVRSRFGTGSYIDVADSALSASYALTASYVQGGTIDTSSYALTAGTASNAITASYALNAQGTGFPFSGSAVITGSLLVSQSGLTVTGSVGITDNLTVQGIISAEKLLVSSSVIYESGSTKFGDSPEDTHEFTGSVLVNGNIDTNSSVKSNQFILNAGNVSVIFTGSVTSGVFGATEYVLPFIPTSSFTAANVEYVATRPGAMRIGNLMSGWTGSSVVMTDVSTTDIGDTSDIRFAFIQHSGYIKLRVESVGSGSYPWTVQSLFKLFPTLP